MLVVREDGGSNSGVAVLHEGWWVDPMFMGAKAIFFVRHDVNMLPPGPVFVMRLAMCVHFILAIV